MLVFLAAFGGVGYAKSSCSRAAHSVYHAVRKHHDDNHESEPPRDPSSSDHSAAWYREHPRPGYFCGTKGNKHQLKLILTQQRYDRLVKSGWKLIGGPFSTEAAARHELPENGLGKGRRRRLIARSWSFQRRQDALSDPLVARGARVEVVGEVFVPADPGGCHVAEEHARLVGDATADLGVLRE